MTTALTADVLQDELAVSLARVLAAANKCARESGVDVLQSLITITQIASGDVRCGSIMALKIISDGAAVI